MQALLERVNLWELHKKALDMCSPSLCDFGSSRHFVSWGAFLFKILPQGGSWAERECFYLNNLQFGGFKESISATKDSFPIEAGGYKVIILKDLRVHGGGVSLWDSLKNPSEELSYLSNQLEILWKSPVFEKETLEADYTTCYQMIIKELDKRIGGSSGIKLDDSVIPRHTGSHGDLHLGQFLSINSISNQYVLHDFEGVPFSELGEKYFSHLWENKVGDLASLLRSVDYWYRVQKKDPKGLTEKRRLKVLDALNVSKEDHQCLSYAYLIRNLYEVAYEEKYRPHWIETPMAGLKTSMEWVSSFEL
ncbi:hypothetical protein OAU52_00790 [bacterium]|nr:hypothetical protein [bacterium]